MGPTHLIIPDSHATPEIDNRRFDWLGQIIVDIQPEVIIDMGDMADMESLCSYDKGKKSFEGRRYDRDIQAYLDAQERMLTPLRKLQKRQAKAKRKQYTPRLVKCRGNHEQRINTLTELQPELDGKVGFEDLREAEAGWEVHPFLTEVEIDGVSYSHYFVSGTMARPIGGDNLGANLINKMHKSCTMGHSHLLDWAVRRAGHEHIMGMSCGCYFEHDMQYVPKSVNRMYWRGLVIKRNVHAGRYDPEFYSMNSIKKDYA